MWYLTLSGKLYTELAAISSNAIKCSRYSFLYEMSPSTAVHFFISAVCVWNVMFDVMMVFIPLKHSMLTSHSFAFSRMIKIYFTSKSTISYDCALYVIRQQSPCKKRLLIRASNYFVRNIKCKNLLLYAFYTTDELFEMLDTFAPFDTNELFGAKYPTSLLTNRFGSCPSPCACRVPNM